MKINLFLAIFLYTISCTSKYEYWNISKFKMSPSALEDNEEVKILFSSQGPDSNKDLEYYIHLIVVSQKTGDTVNVLTTVNNGLDISDKDKVFNYIAQDNPITKLLQTDLDKADDLADVNRGKLKDINKVARDPEFDYIADNIYPTVIGVIGFENLDSIKK
jgi:hypothetical protein